MTNGVISNEFDQFLTVIGKSGADGPVKSAVFMRVICPRTNDVADGIVFANGEDKTDISVVVKKLDAICTRRSSKHVTRDPFFQRQSGRMIDQCVTELRKKANLEHLCCMSSSEVWIVNA